MGIMTSSGTARSTRLFTLLGALAAVVLWVALVVLATRTALDHGSIGSAGIGGMDFVTVRKEVVEGGSSTAMSAQAPALLLLLLPLLGWWWGRRMDHSRSGQEAVVATGSESR